MITLKALAVSTISHAGKGRMGLDFGVGKGPFHYLSQRISHLRLWGKVVWRFPSRVVERRVQEGLIPPLHCSHLRAGRSALKLALGLVSFRSDNSNGRIDLSSTHFYICQTFTLSLVNSTG